MTETHAMRIMIVDPSGIVRKLVAAVLEKAGHVVSPFADGSKALERLKGERVVDVLITSLTPHGMSGLDLCREARIAVGARYPLYILMMSSSDDAAAVVDALDSGADDFIGKPPSPEELLARLRVAKRVTALQSELIRLASSDALTGICNRRAFFEVATRSQRSADKPNAVAIFDIDHFKRVNDIYGHAAGDAVLVAVARTTASDDMTIGRLGGEEFGALLPGQSLEQAFASCDAMRRSVAKLIFPDFASSLRVTCSIGVTAWSADETIDDALRRADGALYEAKANGRDRVVAARASHGAAAVGGAGRTAAVASGR